MNKLSPTVYLGMSADIIHQGHINILEHASKLGLVTVGLLTDAAISEYKRVPIMRYQERERLISSLKFVHRVVPQNELSYRKNLLELKPKFVVHGDDWKEGVQKKTREEVILTLKEFGGELIEIPYTEGVSSTRFIDQLTRNKISNPHFRIPSLRRAIDAQGCVRVIECHSPLIGMLAEEAEYLDEVGKRKFNGLWLSSLTDSLVRGKPDIEVVDFNKRMTTASEIAEVTSLPFIYDGDTGGKPEHIGYSVRTMERIGISAAIFEDKEGLKRNSLFGSDVAQIQSSPEDFAQKMSLAKKASNIEDFMIIARIESLILDKPSVDALERAFLYREAGVDGVMIHTRKKDGREIYDFIHEFRRHDKEAIVVVVPSSFTHITFKELSAWGANIVIYANQVIRATFPVARSTLHTILQHDRTHELEDKLIPINEAIRLIPGEGLEA